MNNDQILPLLKVIIYLLLELTVGFETNIKKNLIVKRNVINSYLLSYQTGTKFIM